MKLPSFRSVMTTSLSVIGTIIVITFGIALLLFSQLETLLPGYAKIEVETANSAQAIGTIIDNPINAPYKFVVYGVSNLIGEPLLATRITSALFGSLCIVVFYFIVRKIHSNRIAFLASLLFACSAWFLHVARLGTADIMLPFSILLFVLAGYWLVHNGTRSIYYIIAIITLGISVYTPGMLWFLLAGLAIRRTKDFSMIKRNIPAWQLVGLIFLLLATVVAPLTWAVVQSPAIVLSLFALPTTMPNILDVLYNIFEIPVSLFIASPKDPVLWLGRLPLLDIAMSALVVLGTYYYFIYRRLDRAKFLAIFIVWASILIALDSGVTNALLIPAIYVGIAGGIALLITQWLTVFPRNPLAQSVGIIAVALIIGVSMTYNLRAYFVAWPHWPPTKAVYIQTESNLVQ